MYCLIKAQIRGIMEYASSYWKNATQKSLHLDQSIRGVNEEKVYTKLSIHALPQRRTVAAAVVHHEMQRTFDPADASLILWPRKKDLV